uniref:Cytochrome c oxidase subunit 3 n=1 Tax=Pneumocystis oryctolagi TaxID=42067 RepID=A0A8A6W3V1_9ASCO|nr:cytochrome c oxidase subunit 3 [Pneumocystis oryctolagi]QTK22302.1 cytochrome c oxidase subunit 3 [Pneumocystis oryctolagi]
MSRSQYLVHPYHLVDASPWPLVSSFSLLSLALSTVLFFQGRGSVWFVLSLFSVIGSVFFWFRDVIAEGSYEGQHTSVVQKGLNWGMVLFIISEVFFFFSIFWAYFHSALSPSVEIGGEWPPQGIQAINPWELPLLNTVILLSSGSTVTYAHHSLIQGNRRGALWGLGWTLLLALFFTFLQGIEYYQSPFTITDGIYGSCFYFGTGFHGLHVIIGTLFLLVGLWRIWNYQLTDRHHLGLESGILYWHFVDIVWLFLFISLYWWGS